MNKKFISLVFILVMLSGIAIILYFYFFRKEISPLGINQTDKITGSKTISPSCLKENEYADYKIKEKKDSPSNAVIVIKEKNSDKLIFEFQIDNIIAKHYHGYEIHNCGVYVIREFNYDYQKGKTLPDFRMELWKYNYKGVGEKIVEENDFRIDPNEKYLALEKSYLGQEDYALVIKDLNTKDDLLVLTLKELLEQNSDVRPGSFGLGKWTEYGGYFRGDIFDGALSTAYYIIEAGTWKINIYAAPPDILAGVERVINFNKLYLAYVDIPTFVGIQEVYEQIVEKAKKEGKQKNLYLYNLRTKEKIKIASTEPDRRFNLKWLSDSELQYELPGGEKKIYKLNEN